MRDSNRPKPLLAKRPVGSCNALISTVGYKLSEGEDRGNQRPSKTAKASARGPGGIRRGAKRESQTVKAFFEESSRKEGKRSVTESASISWRLPCQKRLRDEKGKFTRTRKKQYGARMLGKRCGELRMPL